MNFFVVSVLTLSSFFVIVVVGFFCDLYSCKVSFNLGEVYIELYSANMLKNLPKACALWDQSHKLYNCISSMDF